MVQVGKYNTLRVLNISEFGAFLDGEEHGKILLPNKFMPRGTEIGHTIEVFIYFDSEDRIIATTSKPHGEVGDFVLLKCRASNDVGAFMDWGLPKDLFVPFREQKVPLVEGEWYVVRIYEDSVSDRLVGSTKFHQFYDKTPEAFTYNQEVHLLILYKIDLGFVAIIDQCYQGIIYHSEVFTDLRKGHRCKGYIKNIRDDGKVDLSLHPQGFLATDTAVDQISKYLADHGGSMTITDNSSPGDIYQAFGMSKKQFKKALGALFRKGTIQMTPEKVMLLAPKP